MVEKKEKVQAVFGAYARLLVAQKRRKRMQQPHNADVELGWGVGGVERALLGSCRCTDACWQHKHDRAIKHHASHSCVQRSCVILCRAGVVSTGLGLRV